MGFAIDTCTTSALFGSARDRLSRTGAFLSRITSPAPHTLVAGALVISLAGCAGGSGGTPGAARPSAGGASAQASGAITNPTPTLRSRAAGIGATVRVVNLWVEPGKPGPDVAVVTDRDDPPLLRVRYGAVSDYLAVPLERNSTRYESLYAYPADDIANSTGSPWEFFAAGHQVTAIVHGHETGGVSVMTTHAFWESGDPGEQIYFFGHGPAWPKPPPGKAILLVYAGALNPLPADLEQWWYSSGESCLADATTGQPVTAKTALEPAFFVLEPGTHEITASEVGCGGAPAFPAATVEVGAGDRVGVFPYGTGREDLQLLVLALGRSS